MLVSWFEIKSSMFQMAEHYWGKQTQRYRVNPREFFSFLRSEVLNSSQLSIKNSEFTTQHSSPSMMWHSFPCLAFTSLSIPMSYWSENPIPLASCFHSSSFPNLENLTYPSSKHAVSLHPSRPYFLQRFSCLFKMNWFINPSLELSQSLYLNMA